MKLAQALLLRKQLQQKVEQLQPIKQMGDQGLFETKTKRVAASQVTDEVTISVPRVELSSVTAEYDKYASALRRLDAAIQRTNWDADLKDFKDSDNPFGQ